MMSVLLYSVMTSERLLPIDWGLIEPCEMLQPTWQAPAMHHDELFELAAECHNDLDRFMGSLLLKEQAVQVVRVGDNMPAARIVDVATGEPSRFEYANNIVTGHMSATDGYYLPILKDGFGAAIVVDSRQPVTLTNVSTATSLLADGTMSTTSTFTSVASRNVNPKLMVNPNRQTASIMFQQGLQGYVGAGMLLHVAVKSDKAEVLLNMQGNDHDSNVCFKFNEEGRPAELTVRPGMMTKYVFAGTEFEGLKEKEAPLLDESELEDAFTLLQDALNIEASSSQLDIAETWQRALDVVHGEHATVADMLASR
jgi:hypothetical protein